jgi:WhiB family redox-sensing transcriptional regulator
LVPGWAQGQQAKIGLRDVTSLSDASDFPTQSGISLRSGAGKSNQAINLPCHTADPDLFFTEQPALISLAKSLCSACPVRVQCLDGALSRSEPFGVWGGELFDDGQIILAKRQPGRPRLQGLQRADMELAG